MPSVAFLEKVFLGKRDRIASLRGVELFNLRLVRELCGLGTGVTLCAHASWEETLRRELGDLPGLSLRLHQKGRRDEMCVFLLHDVIRHPEEGDDPPAKARLLGELPQDRVGAGLAEFHLSSGDRPAAGLGGFPTQKKQEPSVPKDYGSHSHADIIFPRPQIAHSSSPGAPHSPVQ